MAMVFFKMYSEILEDRKVQELPGDLFKFWVNLLALANRQKARGSIPPIAEVAFYLRISLDAATANVERLTDAGLIDQTPEGLIPHNWHERQKKVDSTGASRAKRYRERSKTVTRDVTPPSRPRHASVTPSVTPEPSVTSHQRHDAVTQTSRTDKEYNTPHIAPHVFEPADTAEAKPTEPQGELVSPRLESQPQRSREDSADIASAQKILLGDLRTEHLGLELGRSENLRSMIGIPGWKWIKAAEKILEPGISDSARRSFKYLARIAANIDDSAHRKPERSESQPFKHEPPPGGYFRSQKTLARLARLAETGAIAS